MAIPPRVGDAARPEDSGVHALGDADEVGDAVDGNVARAALYSFEAESRVARVRPRHNPTVGASQTDQF